jgi:nucleotide-binding universal stress UspA family protein
MHPPDFLWGWMALTKFMRLSLMKAAHAVVSSVAYRKSGQRASPWLVMSITDAKLFLRDPHSREVRALAMRTRQRRKRSTMTAASTSSLQKEHENSRLGPVGLRFRSILVATDYSPASATAVKLAARLAKEFHAHLYVLHAVEPDLYVADMAGPVPDLQMVNLQAERENLHKYAEHIPDLRTVKHKQIVFLGSPSDAIQSAGQANGIDLLVVGSHGRHGLAKLALGSVAEWAIRRLEYPVLVAGPMCEKTFPPIRSIVLATDFSGEASRSVQYAGSLAQDYSARLTVMHVLPPTGTPEEQKVELRTLGKLRELLPSDSGEWCTLQYQVKTGDIAAAVIGSAQENKANLIILRARHRSTLADHLPRTKISAIIRGAHCPVLVVPPHCS